ncbi:gas vesicle protein GvpU [Evansella sp. LMS18]|jgi:hypothetical protein|uniref:gas vesicle accessory protein GvpU n=1 Tax=Evansella sp. LMS18 TaxID=2924033 RepID=UPI0020D01ED7|nr:gas vesicle accessory protein GvpU [Evansella sp. LMS18]UTR11674.1 gas vesicle protein GvpU [Evansella sp. LMS18]
MPSKNGTKDSMLEVFVYAAQDYGYSIDITLNVHGSLVTGKIVGEQEYFQRLSENFKDDSSETAEKIKDELLKASEDAKKSDNNNVEFIHLKNAQVYVGDTQPTPSENHFLWRGKINDVNGFFLGRIKQKN